MEVIKYKILRGDSNSNLIINLLSEYQGMGLATEIDAVNEGVNKGVSEGVSGVTTSKLLEVKAFNFSGPSHVLGVNGVTEINNTYTAYTISNIKYVTNKTGVTTFLYQRENIESINKYQIYEEFYLGQAYNPIINNETNIERFQMSVTETLSRFQLLNTVEAIGEYGGNFFNVSKQ